MTYLNKKLFIPEIYNLLIDNPDLLTAVGRQLYKDLPPIVHTLFKTEQSGKSIQLVTNTLLADCLQQNVNKSKLISRLYTFNKLAVKTSYLQDMHPNFMSLIHNTIDGELDMKVQYGTLEDVYKMYKIYNKFKVLHYILSNRIRFLNLQLDELLEKYKRLEGNDKLRAIDNVQDPSYNRTPNLAVFSSSFNRYLKYNTQFVTVTKVFSNLYNLNKEVNTFLNEHSLIDYTDPIEKKDKIRVAIDIDQAIIDIKNTLYKEQLRLYEDVYTIFHTYITNTSTTTNENVFVVKGYDIQKYYNYFYYHQYNSLPHVSTRSNGIFTIDSNTNDSPSSGSTLHQACMRKPGVINTAMRFYAENEEVCSMLVLMERGKVKARAILWKYEDTEGIKTLITRIYYIKESDRLQLVHYANVNGYYNICNYPSENNRGITKQFDGYPIVKVKYDVTQSLPWIDTFEYLDLISSNLIVSIAQLPIGIANIKGCRDVQGEIIRNTIRKPFLHIGHGNIESNFVKTNYKSSVLVPRSKTRSIKEKGIIGLTEDCTDFIRCNRFNTNVDRFYEYDTIGEEVVNIIRRAVTTRLNCNYNSNCSSLKKDVVYVKLPNNKFILLDKDYFIYISQYTKNENMNLVNTLQSVWNVETECKYTDIEVIDWDIFQNTTDITTKKVVEESTNKIIYGSIGINDIERSIIQQSNSNISWNNELDEAAANYLRSTTRGRTIPTNTTNPMRYITLDTTSNAA